MSRFSVDGSIAFGPVAPQFGSWEWIGADLCRELGKTYRTSTFDFEPPPSDVTVFVKFKPPADKLRQLARLSRLVYCPVDVYGSAAEIDADWESLRQFSLIFVHCQRLKKYFAEYTQVVYLDHHVKYAPPAPANRNTSGPILWVGNHSNLPPLVEWVNGHRLSEELWVLTNASEDEVPAATLGFSAVNRIRVGAWNERRHLEWVSLARAAIDIKGTDFRARHKPPTKAMDYLASGLPLAMQVDSSSHEHLAKIGFDLATPDQIDWWLSPEYWGRTQVFGQRIRTDLTLKHIADRFVRGLIPASTEV